MSRTINDRVHGQITLSEVASRVVDTKFFCRLAEVKQLGSCLHVYPSATHTRMEHAIGVAHLAMRMATHLRELEPDLFCDDDLLCIELAGLLHDVGHGPYSHVFEKYMHSRGIAWSHEEMGIQIVKEYLEEIIQNNDMTYTATQNIAFVCALIRGVDPAHAMEKSTGRSQQHAVMCEIVNNKRCGVDVDKLDYIMRDNVAVFGKTNAIDASRIIKGSRVLYENGRSILAFCSKITENIVSIFDERLHLHVRVYQHPRVLLQDREMQTRMTNRDNWNFEPREFLDASDRDVPWWSGPRESRSQLLEQYAIVSLGPRCKDCNLQSAQNDSFCRACGATLQDCKANRPLCETELEETLFRKDASLAGCAKVVVATCHLGLEYETDGAFEKIANVPFVNNQGVTRKASSYRARAMTAFQIVYCFQDRGTSAERAFSALCESLQF